jgi:hypothetical protein
MNCQITDEHSTAKSVSGLSLAPEDSHKSKDRGNDHGKSPESVLVGEQSRHNDTKRCKDIRGSTETLSVGSGEAHVLYDGG